MTIREIKTFSTGELADVVHRAAYAETVYMGAAVLHNDENIGYAVVNMLPYLGGTDLDVIQDKVNAIVRKMERGGSGGRLIFDIPAHENRFHGPLLGMIDIFDHEPLTPEINKGCQTQVIVRLTQVNPDKPGVNEKALQDLEDSLRASDDLAGGLSSYLITGDSEDLRDCLQPADSEN